VWHSYSCGQTVGWINMPLGKEVGLGPGHIVLDGDPVGTQLPTAAPPHFRPMSTVAKRSPISATAELSFLQFTWELPLQHICILQQQLLSFSRGYAWNEPCSLYCSASFHMRQLSCRHVLCPCKLPESDPGNATVRSNVGLTQDDRLKHTGNEWKIRRKAVNNRHLSLT